MKVRAAAHVHSDWSYDGSWPLSRIALWFKRAGWNCVFTSEHDRTFDDDRWQLYRKACIENSGDDFLIIPGVEYSDELNVVHILVWGDISFLGRDRKTMDLLQEVNERQGMAVLAHPSRRQAWQQYDPCWSPLLLGIELWNRKEDGVAPGREAISLLNQHSGMLPFAGLDFHRGNQFFPLSMTCCLEVPLTEMAVLDRLREKKFRANAVGISVNQFSEGALSGIARGAEGLRQSLRNLIKGKLKRTEQ